MEEFWHKMLMAKFYSTFKKTPELELSDSLSAIFLQVSQASSLFLFSINDPPREPLRHLRKQRISNVIEPEKKIKMATIKAIT